MFNIFRLFLFSPMDAACQCIFILFFQMAKIFLYFYQGCLVSGRWVFSWKMLIGNYWLLICFRLRGLSKNKLKSLSYLWKKNNNPQSSSKKLWRNVNKTVVVVNGPDPDVIATKASKEDQDFNVANRRKFYVLVIIISSRFGTYFIKTIKQSVPM